MSDLTCPAHRPCAPSASSFADFFERQPDRRVGKGLGFRV